MRWLTFDLLWQVQKSHLALNLELPHMRIVIDSHSFHNYHNYLCVSFTAPLFQIRGEDNTLRPRQNGRHFTDNIFKCIFLNENVWISINISLKFVPKGPINNISALVQIMAWRRPGDKPLSEPMVVRLMTHICVIRPQWVNSKIMTSTVTSDRVVDNLAKCPTKYSQSNRFLTPRPTSWTLLERKFSLVFAVCRGLSVW